LRRVPKDKKIRNTSYIPAGIYLQNEDISLLVSCLIAAKEKEPPYSVTRTQIEYILSLFEVTGYYDKKDMEI